LYNAPQEEAGRLYNATQEWAGRLCDAAKEGAGELYNAAKENVSRLYDAIQGRKCPSAEENSKLSMLCDAIQNGDYRDCAVIEALIGNSKLYINYPNDYEQSISMICYSSYVRMSL
jgi:hypothetical protein